MVCLIWNTHQDVFQIGYALLGNCDGELVPVEHISEWKDEVVRDDDRNASVEN
jgi:hypothetical protein